ncbi:MAG: hypothetical protein CMO55_14515 [Verrucomicrobiales bacterium]|nr:hypothetical protein [Verrucomicrobiales bacterium]
MTDEPCFHRLGGPGMPSCRVVAVDIEYRDANGVLHDGELIDPETEATELDLLRSVAHRLGVHWGEDEFGWWSVLPKAKITDWVVWRQDDNGQRYVVERNLNEQDAELMVAEMEASAHKQTYWAERV